MASEANDLVPSRSTSLALAHTPLNDHMVEAETPARFACEQTSRSANNTYVCTSRNRTEEPNTHGSQLIMHFKLQ